MRFDLQQLALEHSGVRFTVPMARRLQNVRWWQRPKITLDEAAWRLGISKAHLSKIERGEIAQTCIGWDTIDALYGSKWVDFILTNEKLEKPLTFEG